MKTFLIPCFMNNLISIIIPVYNNEPFLERCLNSVVSQSYRNLEIIVVNDGSADDSASIIGEFAERDSRIRPFHQQNQGVSAARNVGLQNATGDFVGFVDADDELLPDMYAFLLNNLLKNDADISHCGFELVKKQEVIKFHDSGILLIQNKAEGVKEILLGKRVEPSACTKLYRRRVLRDVFFPVDIKNNEDVLFNVHAFYHAEKSIFEDVVKYRYHHNLQSASHSVFTERKARDVFNVANRIKDLIKIEEIKHDVDVFYAGKILNLLQSLKRNNLYNSMITKDIRCEAMQVRTKKLGFRLFVTKGLLLYFPYFYDFSRWLYDLFLGRGHKWKNQ